MQELKVLQCNLGRERLAHEVAFATMAEENFDLMVVGEPNQKIVEGNGWVTDVNRAVAVYFRNRKVNVHRVEKKAGYLVIHTPGVTIVAGYISPNVNLATFEEAVERMLGGRRQEDDLIILGDLNAKSPMWGSPISDRRGEVLEEWIEALGLVVLNDGKKPTFVRGDSRSFIDVTFASANVARYIENWMVLDTDSATLHRYIAFEIRGTRLKEEVRIYRTKNWDKFGEAIRRNMGEWHRDRFPEIKMAKDVGKAYRECLGPPIRGNGRGMPYWWNEDIVQAREAMVRARREATRARRRQGGDLLDEETRNGLVEIYKERKRGLNKLILRSKAEHWERLCKDLEDNPWGDAYRIATKRFGVRPYEMSLERKKEVARELFPAAQDNQGEREMWREPVEAPFFTVEELQEALASMKTGKAPGVDGIPPEAIKELGKVAEEPLLAVLNSLLTRQHIPGDWKVARLVLIPKAGDGQKSRPICLLNSLDKLYETLIKSRLEREIEERGGLSEQQYGFRKGRSTIHAVMEAVDIRRNIEWAVMITLDVKNAFNTVRWKDVDEELERREISQYLRNLLRGYLSDRKIELARGEVLEVYAGVPQGSVLGPTLWNMVYDGVLRLGWPTGIKVVGFADDLAVVAVATREDVLVRNTNETLRMVDEWLSGKGLELAPQKTEAVMLRGPRRKKNTTFRVRDTVVRPQKAIKYLGVWVDDQGTFGRHVKEVTTKAAGRTAALSKIMPNIGGPSHAKRKIIYEVVASTLLYAAPVWQSALRIGRYEKMMTSAQRRALLRVAMAYRTVSTPAIQVITGIPPITLMVEERGRLFRREDKGTAQAKREEREATIELWQRKWENDAGGKGQWTRTLIPQLETWLKCTHRDLHYFMTQALTGHGSFRTFTHKIGKVNNDMCVYCGDIDTPAHTLFQCPRWETERREAERELGEVLGPGNMVPLLISNKENWAKINTCIEKIMKRKETDEREIQA